MEIFEKYIYFIALLLIGSYFLLKFEKRRKQIALKEKENEILNTNVKALDAFYIRSAYDFALKNIELNYFYVTKEQRTYDEKEVKAHRYAVNGDLMIYY